MPTRLRYLPLALLGACLTAALHLGADHVAVHQYAWHTGMHYIGRAHQIRSFVSFAVILLFPLGLGGSRITKTGAAIVAGGALANALAPFIWGGVPDYFFFPPSGRLFNTADAALTVGLLLMLAGTVKWVLVDAGNKRRRGSSEDNDA